MDIISFSQIPENGPCLSRFLLVLIIRLSKSCSFTSTTSYHRLYKTIRTTLMSAKEECVLAEGENVQKSTTRPPYPKRKVAIMLGYCGTNYQGMQL